MTVKPVAKRGVEVEQGIYVDVLLATNYIINLLLILCVGKMSGRSPKRRRIVAAALFGAATSLTIFLPFIPFLPSLLMKLVISSAIVFIAFPFIRAGEFLKQLFLFFLASFFFAGAMLGVWMLFSPRGMTYYNGIVYFDVSSVLLIATTIAAYLLLTAAQRLTRPNKLAQEIYRTTIYLGENSAELKGLVDTGNRLVEPFSGVPVIVAPLEKLKPILPPEFVGLVEQNTPLSANFYRLPIKVRMVPYENVGGSGMIPAFKADLAVIEAGVKRLRIEEIYVGASVRDIGDERYDCLLNPGLISIDEAIKIH